MTSIIFFSKKLQERGVTLVTILCVVLSHLSNSVYLSKSASLGTNYLHETGLIMVKHLVGKQLLIKKKTICRSLSGCLKFSLYLSIFWNRDMEN